MFPKKILPFKIDELNKKKAIGYPKRRYNPFLKLWIKID
jgi:hypothetical protein